MPIRLLVLTEDGSKTAPDVVQRLVEHALRLVEPALLRPVPPTWEPVPKPCQLAVRANAWKDKTGKRHQQQVGLAAWLAEQLATGRDSANPRLVIWHVDLDCKWSKANKSENGLQLQAFLTNYVWSHLQPKRGTSRLRGPRGQAASPQGDPERALARLIPMHPAYSIEAWTFQHFHRLRSWIPAKDVSAHSELATWEPDRARVDEVGQIADRSAVGTVVGKTRNLELVERGWPAQAVYDARASFAAFVDALRAVVTDSA